MSTQGPAASFAEHAALPRRRRTWIVPLALLVILLAMLVAVLVIARRANDSGVPARPDAYATPALAFATVPFDIQQRSADGSLTISATKGETFDVNLDGVAVEVLEPITIADIVPGERVTIIGRPNDVRNFVIMSIIAFGEGPGLALGDGGFRSEAGFEGWEAGRDQALRPMMAGTVVEASNDRFVLDTAAGQVTVQLSDTENPRPPIFLRLHASPDFVINSGDRLALAGMTGDDPETATAALVQPAGAEPPPAEAATGG